MPLGQKRDIILDKAANDLIPVLRKSNGEINPGLCFNPACKSLYLHVCV